MKASDARTRPLPSAHTRSQARQPVSPSPERSRAPMQHHPHHDRGHGADDDDDPPEVVRHLGRWPSPPIGCLRGSEARQPLHSPGRGLAPLCWEPSDAQPKGPHGRGARAGGRARTAPGRCRSITRRVPRLARLTSGRGRMWPSARLFVRISRHLSLGRWARGPVVVRDPPPSLLYPTP